MDSGERKEKSFEKRKGISDLEKKKQRQERRRESWVRFIPFLFCWGKAESKTRK